MGASLLALAKSIYYINNLSKSQVSVAQSYVAKRSAHLCRALYGEAILVYLFGAPI